MANTWETSLRRLVKDQSGAGWSLRGKGKSTTQVTRRWSDGTRSSATVGIPWERSNGPKLLALVERLAKLTAPVDTGGQGLSLAKAANLIQLEATGSSVEAVRTGSVNWVTTAERYRQHRVEVSGEVSAAGWQRKQRRWVTEFLEILGKRRGAPKNGETLLEQLVAAHPGTTPGTSGRKELLREACKFLDFAVDRCGAPEQWRAPRDLKALIGKRPTPKPDGVPLLDDQALRIYRSIPNPQWRLAFGITVCFGIRPGEIGCCRAENGLLRVEGLKRNSSGASGGRIVHALDPVGFPNMGLTLLALLEEHGSEALPTPGKSHWSSRLGLELVRHTPEWPVVMEEAASTGQGHLTCYSARHGYAFRGTRLGLDHRTLAKLMGHTPAVHLQHYGRWTDEQSVAAAVAAAIARRDTNQSISALKR